MTLLLLYLGKDRQNATQAMTVAGVTMRSLTRRSEGVGQKLYMNSFFFPDLFDDLHRRGINCCGPMKQYP
jgi:hypothetical protein